MEKLYTYKIKFLFGKLPYYVWVDAKNEDEAKDAAKRKVRGTYGRKRQYKHLETTLIGEATPLPEETPNPDEAVANMIIDSEKEKEQ